MMEEAVDAPVHHRRRRWPVAVAALLVLIAAVVIVTARWWYTPTTSGIALNDTSRTISLENCNDSVTTIRPDQSSPVQPFSNARQGCTVFRGDGDLGNPIGCLVFPSRNGAVVPGSTAKLSDVVPLSSHLCSR